MITAWEPIEQDQRRPWYQCQVSLWVNSPKLLKSPPKLNNTMYLSYKVLEVYRGRIVLISARKPNWFVEVLDQIAVESILQNCEIFFFTWLLLRTVSLLLIMYKNVQEVTVDDGRLKKLSAMMAQPFRMRHFTKKFNVSINLQKYNLGLEQNVRSLRSLSLMWFSLPLR